MAPTLCPLFGTARRVLCNPVARHGPSTAVDIESALGHAFRTIGMVQVCSLIKAGEMMRPFLPPPPGRAVGGDR